MKDCCGSCKYAKLAGADLPKEEAKKLLFPYVCRLEKKRGKYYGNDHKCEKFESMFTENRRTLNE